MRLQYRTIARFTVICIAGVGCAGHQYSAGVSPDDSGVVPPTVTATTPGWTVQYSDVTGGRKVLAAVGIPRFFAAVAEPSPYMTDFFGIQYIKPVPRKTVIADFVPRYATVAVDSPHVLTLQFRDGPRVDFHYRTLLFLNGSPYHIPYAEVQYGEPTNYFAAMKRFRDAIHNAGLDDRYLVPNPYYNLEKTAKVLLDAKDTLPKVPFSTDTAAFGSARHAILLLGDTHGQRETWERARSWIERPDADWVAFEMLPVDLSDAVRTYSQSRDTTSQAFRDARAKILEHFSTRWAGLFGEPMNQPLQNPYYQLVELARRTGKEIYALDAPLLYTAFRFGEFPLGATTRNCIWAPQLPTSGRGIIYGGSAHFTQMPNFQTCLLRERNTDVQFFEPPRSK